jgi:cobalt/nickel transport system ATP-binding protein
MKPEVLVLDEPTAGLDPLGRRELSRLIGGLDQTVIIITHDLPFALSVCERSVILHGGTVAADGETEHILFDDELLSKHHLELPYRFSTQAT